MLTTLSLGLLNSSGTPSKVRNLQLSLQDSGVFLDWMALLPLNIIDFNINITYCVDVALSPFSPLHSTCGIHDTEFLYQLPSTCKINFTVTPVNVVGPGEASTLQYTSVMEEGKAAHL